MKVTLVVPVRNAEDTLDALFDSIVRQSRCLDQVVFVDNGSRDRSRHKIASFQSAHPEIEVVALSEGVRGPGSARNRALEACIGDVVAFTDSDCRLQRNWTRHIVEFFERNPNAGLLGGVEMADDPQTLWERYSAFVLANRRRSGSISIASKSDWFDGHLVSTLNLAVRRQALIDLKGFASWRAGEDIDFWMRALERGFRVQAGDPNMVVWHRQRASLTGFARQQWEYALAVPRLLKRHFRGTALVATSRRRLLGAPLFTGLFEMNPHTALFSLLLLVGWRSMAAYLLFLTLKPLHFYLRSRHVGFPLTPRECLAMTIPFEVFRWVVDLSSLVGSLKHKAVCVR